MRKRCRDRTTEGKRGGSEWRKAEMEKDESGSKRSTEIDWVRDENIRWVCATIMQWPPVLPGRVLSPESDRFWPAFWVSPSHRALRAPRADLLCHLIQLKCHQWSVCPGPRERLAYRVVLSKLVPAAKGEPLPLPGSSSDCPSPAAVFLIWLLYLRSKPHSRAPDLLFCICCFTCYLIRL